MINFNEIKAISKNIKYEQSEKLESELEKFLKRGGKITKMETVVLKRGQKQKPRSEKPYEETFKFNLGKGFVAPKEKKEPVTTEKKKSKIVERLERQSIAIHEYNSWAGTMKWSRLSKVSHATVLQLEGVYDGRHSIPCEETWNSVLKGIEILRTKQNKVA